MKDMRKIKILLAIAVAMVVGGTGAEAKVVKMSVPDPMTWLNDELAACAVGDTVVFSVPVIVNRNYGYGDFKGLTVSVRRIFSPTNQAVPMSDEYKHIVALNSKAPFTLTGCGYRRNGEKLLNLKGVVTDRLTVKYISGKWAGNNTRAAIEHNPPSVDMNGTHNVLVCGANLEYYLVQTIGGSMGPQSKAEHQRQRTKVQKALAEIHADIYGLVEVEQGQAALREIASDLTTLTGSHYDYVDDQGTVNGTYTKSGYVYNSDRIQPVGIISQNNTVVRNRKMTQGFILLENNERFIYSINHFKAKSGSGTGKNADQGDGQGTFNYNRVQEAESVLQDIEPYQHYYQDNDVLIMGDLNAYGKEDPIRKFTDAGLFDLHRYFHADSSYSYVYGEQAGYLDHAIANNALIKQVTGMAAWHVNSDESDQYTYDKSSDLSVFRYSDHDPVLVGLRLDSTLSIPMHGWDLIDNVRISTVDGDILIENVAEMGEQYGYYEIYNATGTLVQPITRIEESPCPVANNLTAGVYVVRVYYAGKIKSLKLLKK